MVYSNSMLAARLSYIQSVVLNCFLFVFVNYQKDLLLVLIICLYFLNSYQIYHFNAKQTKRFVNYPDTILSFRGNG